MIGDYNDKGREASPCIGPDTVQSATVPYEEQLQRRIKMLELERDELFTRWQKQAEQTKRMQYEIEQTYKNQKENIVLVQSYRRVLRDLGRLGDA